MKTILAFLFVFGALIMSSRPTEATFGFGYRANNEVHIDRCYRTPAWDYAVRYYILGSNRGRYAHKYRKHRAKNRHHAMGCCCKR